MPLAFRQKLLFCKASLRRQSRQVGTELIGKAEPFRKEGGEAAVRNCSRRKKI